MSTIQIKRELQPFTVPNYVIQVVPPGTRQQGLQEAPKYHLSELDVETLEGLCAQFRRDVFSRAGKELP